MKVRKPTDFALLVGIDWADRKHDLCERHPITGAASYHTISNKPEAIQEWALALKKRFPNQVIAVACELKKGPLIYALSRYSHIVIFPLNPTSVAKYRKAFAHSGAKDDPSDAFLQSEFLLLHMNKLRVLEPESSDVRRLTQFVEIRRKLVQDRVRLTNRMVAALKNYFPHILEWFDERDTRIFCDFVTQWPNLECVKKARKSTLMRFFESHGSRYRTINQQRLEAIQHAQSLTNDVGVLEPNQLTVSLMAGQLRLLIDSIELLDKKIKKTYRAMKDFFVFNSFPGAGPQMGPRLLVAFGENRSRYDGCEEIQKYSGVAPVLERSGQQSWIHWRYCCPKFLRQTFVEWAGLSIRYSFWAKAYYEQQKAKGKPHQTIIRALAFKWIRILYRCWQDSKPYNESVYLNALKKRKSPLLKYAVS